MAREAIKLICILMRTNPCYFYNIEAPHICMRRCRRHQYVGLTIRTMIFKTSCASKKQFFFPLARIKINDFAVSGALQWFGMPSFCPKYIYGFSCRKCSARKSRSCNVITHHHCRTNQEEKLDHKNTQKHWQYVGLSLHLG